MMGSSLWNEKRGYSTKQVMAKQADIEGNKEWQCTTCKKYVQTLHQPRRYGECDTCSDCYESVDKKLQEDGTKNTF